MVTEKVKVCRVKPGLLFFQILLMKGCSAFHYSIHTLHSQYGTVMEIVSLFTFVYAIICHFYAETVVRIKAHKTVCVDLVTLPQILKHTRLDLFAMVSQY